MIRVLVGMGWLHSEQNGECHWSFYLQEQARGSRIIMGLVALRKIPAGLFIFVPPIVLIRILLWAPYPGYQGWADFFTWFMIFVFGFILYADNTFQAIIRKQGKIFIAISIVCIISLIIANFFGGLSTLENAANYSAGYMLYQLVISITL